MLCFPPMTTIEQLNARGQGYLFSRPLSTHAAEEIIAALDEALR